MDLTLFCLIMLSEPVEWRRKQQTTRYSCLENSVDKGASEVLVYEDARSWTRLKPVENADERLQFCYSLNIILAIWNQGLHLKSKILNTLLQFSFSYPQQRPVNAPPGSAKYVPCWRKDKGYRELGQKQTNVAIRTPRLQQGSGLWGRDVEKTEHSYLANFF